MRRPPFVTDRDAYTPDRKHWEPRCESRTSCSMRSSTRHGCPTTAWPPASIGLGRDGLALLYDHASVRRWIRDGTSPRGRVPGLICKVLGARLGRSVMLADIGMERLAGQPTGDGSLGRIVDHATALWHSDFKQAAALRAAAPVRGPSAIAPVFEWENPPDDLDVARREGRAVDVAQVRFLRAARTRYEHMYREAGGIPVRPRVVAFLNDSAAPLLKGSYDDGTGGSYTGR